MEWDHSGRMGMIEKQENRWSEYEREKEKVKDTKDRAEGGEVKGKWGGGLPLAHMGHNKHQQCLVLAYQKL